jgi:pSer/pThr/pTyr-binding forkhead associated (FHA) protein
MNQHPTDLFLANCGAAGALGVTVSGPGGAPAQRHVLDHPFALVGRHELSCIRLEDAAVSWRHAYFHQFGGRAFGVDLGSRTGVRRGGESRPTGWIGPDQGVQIGPFTLELATAARPGGDPWDEAGEGWDPLQDPAPDPELLAPVTLEVGAEAGSGSRWRVDRVLVLVGRSPACRIRLRHASVSRFHCSLVGTPEGVWVVDLLSRSGTSLNGKLVRWALVEEGGRLQVGPFGLRLRYEDRRTRMSPPGLSGIQNAARVQPADHTARSELQLPASWGDQGEGEQDASAATLPPRSLAPPATLPVPAGPPMVAPDNGRAQTLAGPPGGLAATEAPGLADRADEHTAALQQMQQAQAELARSQDQVRALQAELDQARDRWREAEAGRRHLDDARAECDRLRARAEALAVRAAEADRMEEALRGWRVEISRLRAQIRTSQQAAASTARELEVVGRERDQLREEAKQVRAQLEAGLTSAGRLGPLPEELEALRAERDRLQGEQRAITAQAERLRAQLSEREQALAEAAAARDAPGMGPGTAHQEAEQRFQAAVARFTRLVDEIQSLRAELGQQQGHLGEPKGARGWLWSSSSPGREQGMDEALYRRLETLRAEATTEREAAAAAAAEAVRADLARQLAEVRGRLKEAAERADRLEAELQEHRGRSTPLPAPGLSPAAGEATV